MSSLVVVHCNLIKVPIISHCHQLRAYTITHSNINFFHGKIPKKLVELNLRWNTITYFGFTIALRLRKLDLNINHFTDYTVIEGSGRTFSYFQQKTYVHNIMNIKNTRVIIKNIKATWRQSNNPIGIEETIFSNQSVHLSSVNVSVHKSILAIREWIETNKLTVFNVTIKFLITSLERSDIHSITEFTYKDLFNLVWFVAMNHKDKLDVIKRISFEITDSMTIKRKQIY